MKIALFGLGAATEKIHLPAYRKLSKLSVVGGYDPYKQQNSFDFPVYKSLEELVAKASPDIVTVATPTNTHFELVKFALNSGCHVLVEKPFMSNLAEADEIIALAKRKQRWVVVNNQYRFMNIHQAAKEKIESGELGELLFISANQTFNVSKQTEAGWRGDDVQRTCKEFGIHVLDLCRFYFGEEPISIMARMPKGKNASGPDYLNLLLLEFSGDRVAHITLDRLTEGPHRYLEMRLDGANAIIETSIGGKAAINLGIRPGSKRPFVNLEFAMGGQAKIYRGEKSKVIDTDPLDLFANATSKLMAAFISALENNTTPPCNADDNRNTLALMLAAYESNETKRPVYLSP